MLKVWNVFPPGMYVDNIVKVAKRELAWEVDYNREAEFTANFGEMIRNIRISRFHKFSATYRRNES